MNLLIASAQRMAKAQADIARGGSGGGGGGGSRGAGGGPPTPGGGGRGPSNNDIGQLVNAINRLVQAQSQGGGQPSWGSRTSSTAVGTYLGNKATGGANFGAAMAGGSTTQALAGAIPYVGSAIAGIMQSIQGFYAEFEAEQTARSRTLGTTGRSLGGFRGIGAKYGMAGAEASSALGDIAGQSALTGSRLTDDFAGAALRAQMYGGISNAASIVGAGAAAGGTVKDPTKLMMQAVSSGVRAGVEETRLGDYMGTVASWAQQSRDQGFLIEPTSILEMVNGFANANIKGMRAVEMAKSVAQGLRNAGKGGSLSDIMALKAVGFTGDSSGLGYYDARDKLEKNPESAVAGIVAQVKRSTSDPNGQLRLLETVLSSMGMSKSVQDMRDLLGVKGVSEATVTEGEAYLSSREKAVGEGFGTAASAARYRNRRSALGGRVGAGARSSRELDLEVSESILPAAAKAEAAAVKTIREGIDAYQKSGIDGLVGWSASFMVRLGDNIVKAIREGFNPSSHRGGTAEPVKPGTPEDSPLFGVFGAPRRIPGSIDKSVDKNSPIYLKVQAQARAAAEEELAGHLENATAAAKRLAAEKGQKPEKDVAQ